MEASCNVAKARHLAKVLQFLARVGEDVFLVATAKSFKLVTMNAVETAFAQVTFVTEHFFSAYIFDTEKMEKDQNELTQSLGSKIYANGAIQARMNVKHLLMAFRILQDIREFTIVVQVDLAKFCLILEQENGIRRTYKFNIDEHQNLMQFDPNSLNYSRQLVSLPNTFLDSLKHLSAKQCEVKLEIVEDGLVLTSDLQDGPCTTLNIGRDQFDNFKCAREDPNSYWRAFTLKEFKGVLQIMETLGYECVVNLPNKEDPMYCTNREQDCSVKVELTLACQSPGLLAGESDEEEESMVYAPPGGYSFQSEDPLRMSNRMRSSVVQDSDARRKRSRPNSQSKVVFGSQKRRKVNSQSSLFGASQENRRDLHKDSDNLFASDDENIHGDRQFCEARDKDVQTQNGSQNWTQTQPIDPNSVPSSLTPAKEEQRSVFYSSAKDDMDEDDDSEDLFA